jgi:hypothetical protein
MLAEQREIHVVTPPRARMTPTQLLRLVRACAG